VQATVYNLAGKEVDTIELDDAIFGVTPNIGVIQQAVLRQQANARQGTHSTKTRAHVSGGGRKPWRQKGTGRARQGSTRAPQWTHGGVVFGPHPRSYEQDMPRKMRRLAIRGVLSAKVADGQIVFVDSFDEIEPRTKVMKEALATLNVTGSALIMTPDRHDNLEKAASNLPNVKTMPAQMLSVVDMLKHDYLVMPRASVDVIQGILGSTGGRRKVTILRGNATGNGTSNGTGNGRTEVKAEAASAEAADNVAFETTETVAEVAEASTAAGDVSSETTTAEESEA
jgi:large subunit ribosomal protein L4